MPSAPPRPSRSPASAKKRLAECKRRLEQDLALERHMVKGHRAWRERGVASDGSRRMAGHNLKEHPLPEQPSGKLNLTDPDSRNLKTPRGFLQGYNAQALVGARQIIVAAETSTEAVDSVNLEPMVEAACAELRAVGIDDKPGVLLADAGYWQADAIDAVVGHGIQTLIPPRRRSPQRAQTGASRRPL